MNERIREIAKQALDYAEKNQSADIPQHWFELHNKKFAELIVAECVDIADDYIKDALSDYLGHTRVEEHLKCHHPRSKIGLKIKQHFGVE